MRASNRLAGIALAIAWMAGGEAAASGLALDGQTSVLKQIGSSLSLTLTGTPGRPAFLFVDIDKGPTNLFSQSLPIGFSPAMLIVPLGNIPVGGTLAFNFPLPNDPTLDQRNVYLLGVVVGSGFPFGYDFSNGASLQFSELPFARTDLAGEPLADYPHFQFVRAFQHLSPLQIAVDTGRFPFAQGKTAKMHVVAKKTIAEWNTNPAIVDVSPGGPETFLIAGATIQANVFTVSAGSLPAFLGTPYDVVLDLNQNDVLDAGDIIDGYSDEAGLYMFHDVTLPGPHPVTEVIYSGGTFLGQDTYYPTNIASLGQLPLIVVSHGNGHNYQWYDHIGNHMASYGYIVMSHQNNTVPGIETASTTTLTNTDYFLGNLATIAGGALNGHVDSSRITWIGHSRGGEGVARAYDRIFDGTYVPTHFGLSDIKLISSLAPTDFLGVNSSNPHGATYHLWTAAADGDVNGCANSDIAQTFHLHDRAEKERLAITLHGVGHGDFHASTGSVAAGPCLVGKPNTHTIMRGYLLPLVEHYIQGNIGAKDFLWRQWESFRPASAPVNSCVVVDLMYRETPDLGKFVIDDYQTNPSPFVASSGAAVAATVTSLAEGRLDDANTVFTNDAADVFNGSTLASASDTSRGATFQYDLADAAITWQIPIGSRDFTSFSHVSLRGAQATRHPLTIAALGDVTFEVTLRDALGNSSTIDVGVYGGGFEEPYQRTSCGIGTGWHNEFETIRIRLRDFLANGSGLELSSITEVELDFGPSHGSPRGRLVIDELELTKD